MKYLIRPYCNGNYERLKIDLVGIIIAIDWIRIGKHSNTGLFWSWDDQGWSTSYFEHLNWKIWFEIAFELSHNMNWINPLKIIGDRFRRTQRFNE